MRTDASELSLHELESTEINLEQLEAVSGGLLRCLKRSRIICVPNAAAGRLRSRKQKGANQQTCCKCP
jgi:hypothetical protein